MKCKTFTARIIRLWPYDDSVPLRKSYSRYGSPISFAEDILGSLPEGQFLIEVWNGTHIWTFETRLASTWRAGVPVRPIH
jgi:hypothetical protein